MRFKFKNVAHPIEDTLRILFLSVLCCGCSPSVCSRPQTAAMSPATTNPSPVPPTAATAATGPREASFPATRPPYGSATTPVALVVVSLPNDRSTSAAPPPTTEPAYIANGFNEIDSPSEGHNNSAADDDGHNGWDDYMLSTGISTPPIASRTTHFHEALPQDLSSLSLLHLKERTDMALVPITRSAPVSLQTNEARGNGGNGSQPTGADNDITTKRAAQRLVAAQSAPTRAPTTAPTTAPATTQTMASTGSRASVTNLSSSADSPKNNKSNSNNKSNNNNKSNSDRSSAPHYTRVSARKVESRLVLPKPQKSDAPMLNYIFDTFSAANKHHHHDQRYGPHFEDVQGAGQPTNLTVQAGSSIHLNCRISLLQDKTVSWVRRHAQGEDALDLLTVGLHTYTGDKRYKIEFQYPNNWRLKIANVKKDDEAMYECQISTHPPRLIQINLHVNAPKVMIVDEFGDPLQEKYYETDSTLQLACVVRNVAMTTSAVYWKHGEDVLNYDVTRGGVSVKTELMEDGANSTLFIARIKKADSGNYTCSISDYQNFTIVVHILNGESFAELHHGGAIPVRTSDLLQALALHLVFLSALLFCWSPSGRIYR